MARYRSKATGVVVSTSTRLGSEWEPADAPKRKGKSKTEPDASASDDVPVED